MQSQSGSPEGNTLSPLPTDSIGSFLGYMQRCLSDFVASDARPIPGLLQEHQSNDSSSDLVNGTPRISFDTVDVINQHSPHHFAESPPLRRAGWVSFLLYLWVLCSRRLVRSLLCHLTWSFSIPHPCRDYCVAFFFFSSYLLFLLTFWQLSFNYFVFLRI